MKLLILSNLLHYRRNGKIVAWGTTVREINHLAKMFDEIRHVACMHPGPAPDSTLPYESDRIKLVPLPPSGGRTLGAKLNILRNTPLYLKTIYQELPWADVIHVRCPNNIGLLAILLLSLVSSPQWRWIKYAGNWDPNFQQAWSYAFQRWFLNMDFSRGVVTINGHWPDQPPHVFSIVNPSLTLWELEDGQTIGSQKQLNSPIYLLHVARLGTKKGTGRALQIAKELNDRGIDLELHVVGDGVERPNLETWAKNQGLASIVTFHGWFPKPMMPQFYNKAHFLILPSIIPEGWPNVISEALAHGVVPLAGAISSIPQLLKEIKSGQAFDPLNISAFVQAILHYMANPETWKVESLEGLKIANLFTYTRYLKGLNQIFYEEWGIKLGFQS
jgi:glycosyltransferase involved in cell wall biosynthesis